MKILLLMLLSHLHRHDQSHAGPARHADSQIKSLFPVCPANEEEVVLLLFRSAKGHGTRVKSVEHRPRELHPLRLEELTLASANCHEASTTALRHALCSGYRLWHGRTVNCVRGFGNRQLIFDEVRVIMDDVNAFEECSRVSVARDRLDQWTRDFRRPILSNVAIKEGNEPC